MTASPLLNFDDLVKLAKQDPQALETLRQQVCHQLIASASPEDQRKLKGLQFKIDMERRRSKSRLNTCTHLSDLMNNSFAQLKGLLSQTQEQLPHRKTTQTEPMPNKEVMHSTASIFPFPSR